MKKLTSNWLIIVLGIVALLLGFNYFQRPLYQRFQAEQLKQQQTTESQTRPISPEVTTADQLTTKQKIAQLLVVPLEFKTTKPASGSAATVLTHGQLSGDEVFDWLTANDPGLVVLQGGAATEVIRATTERIVVSSGSQAWPILIAGEQANTTLLKPDKEIQAKTLAEACSQTPEQVAQHWNEVGYGWQTAGINMVFGPVIDVPKSGSFVAKLSCANNARAFELARAYIAGFGRNGVLPVMAHFPGVGEAKTDPQQGNQTVKIDLVDIEPFDRLLKEFPTIGVLVSTVRVAGEFDEQPCAITSGCLAQFPKQHPRALLIADRMGPDLAKNLNRPLADLVASAVLAGNHMVMIDSTVSLPEVSDLLNQLVVRYQDDADFKNRVDENLQRLATLKLPPAEPSPAGTVTPTTGKSKP